MQYFYLTYSPYPNFVNSLNDVLYLFLFINLFYLFIFGCIGSLLLRAGFL